MSLLRSFGLLLASAHLLSGATLAYTFSGTWGGSLGPFQAGTPFSGGARWNGPASVGNNNLTGFWLTMPPAAGFSPAFLQNPPITSAVANYGAGGVFQFVQIDFRSTANNTDYHLFLSPSAGASIWDQGFTQFIGTSSYSATGPAEIPEPGTAGWAVFGLVAALWISRFRLRLAT